MVGTMADALSPAGADGCAQKVKLTIGSDV